MSTNSTSLDYLGMFLDIFRLEKLVFLIISMILLVSLVKATAAISQYFYSRVPTKKVLIFQFLTIFSFVVYIFGTIYIFYNAFNPPREVLITFLGSATFAMGFALKDLVSSLISGVTIIVDPPFQVGDRVKYKDIYGEIIHIGLRAVRVQNLDNQVVTIPNSNFIKDEVLCASQGKIHLNIVMDFYLELDSDIDKAKDILYEVVVTSRYVYLDEPVIILVDNHWQVEKMCLKLTVKAHVIDARFEKNFQADIVGRATKYLLESKNVTLFSR